MLTGWLWASAGCLAVSFALFVYLFTTNRGKRPFIVWFAGVFAAILVMFLPLHGEMAWSVQGARTILVSVFHTVQVFAAGCDFEVVTDGLGAVSGQDHTAKSAIVYEVWAAALFVTAPIFTFGFILSFFKNVTAYCRLFKAYGRDLYVFSELNDKSLQLASDLRAQHKKAAIVFTDVFEENNETVFEMVDAAKTLGAICFKKDISAIGFQWHSSKKSITFFAIGDNETENLNQSLRLIETYKQRKDTHVYVFSTKVESEILLTKTEKGEVKVRRINEVRSLINYVLYKQGHILFDSAVKETSGDACISAVVIGMGRHGTEMIRALAWYGQMDGYSLKIHAFDKDPLAKERFTALAPELMSEDYNGVNVTGEAQYEIVVHDGVDVGTASFAQELASLGHTTYVLVALGMDDLNINTAVTLRMYFERMNIHPVIQTIVYDPQQKKALEGVRNFKGQPYDIDCIGDRRTIYTEEVIMDSVLEKDALNRHLKWGNEEEFWTYEYNYRSSIASAIHRLARIHCGIAGASKAEDDLTPTERETIERLEHRRWNAYMRSEGYVYSGSKDRSSRNDLGKMHYDLVNFADLTDEEKRKDSRIGTE